MWISKKNLSEMINREVKKIIPPEHIHVRDTSFQSKDISIKVISSNIDRMWGVCSHAEYEAIYNEEVCYICKCVYIDERTYNPDSIRDQEAKKKLQVKGEDK